MKTTTLALAAATLLGGLTLGLAPATAAQPGLQLGDAPTAYSQMSSRREMMMRRKMMMRKRSMHHRMMHGKMMHRRSMHRM